MLRLRRQRRAQGRSRFGDAGFTMPEIILVIVLVSAMIVYAMAQISDTMESYDLSSATMKAMSAIRYAQQQAHARNGWYGVRFQTNPVNQFDVYVTDGVTDTDVADPLNPAAPFIVDLMDQFDVSISAVNIGGGDKVEFNPLGTPYADRGGSALAADGTVTLLSGGQARIVRIVRNTGRVELQ